MSQTRRSSHLPRHVYDSDSDSGYGGSPKDYFRQQRPTSLPRENSLVKSERDDSEWDTDYDPKDKYYLSPDDDPYNLYAPERKSSPHRGTDRDLSESAGRDRDPSPGRYSSTRSNKSHPHGPSHRDRYASSDRYKPPSSSTSSSRPKPPSSSYSSHNTSKSRPRTTRAASSSYAPSSSTRPRAARTRSHTKPRRPHTTRAASSSLGALRSGKPKSTRAKPAPAAKIPWGQAARCALEAGAVAALKVRNDPAPLAAKGTKVVTAALGAAVVDTIVSKKMPQTKGGIRHAAMRQVAEGLIGNFVIPGGTKKMRRR